MNWTAFMLKTDQGDQTSPGCGVGWGTKSVMEGYQISMVGIIAQPM